VITYLITSLHISDYIVLCRYVTASKKREGPVAAQEVRERATNLGVGMPGLGLELGMGMGMGILGSLVSTLWEDGGLQRPRRLRQR
jgi:hypothetical protein